MCRFCQAVLEAGGKVGIYNDQIGAYPIHFAIMHEAVYQIDAILSSGIITTTYCFQLCLNPMLRERVEVEILQPFHLPQRAPSSMTQTRSHSTVVSLSEEVAYHGRLNG